MHFANPLAFLLVAVIPVGMILTYRKRSKPGVRFSSTAPFGSFKPTLRQRLSSTPSLLQFAALALLAVAMARPQVGIEFVRDVTRGVAIELVVDRSGSMGAEMNYDGDRFDRLETVKRVIDEFVNGGKRGLPGRPNDLIGLVAFARYADTISPLTLSHGALDGFLDTVNIVTREDEDGTSIGDAIALAAARLHTAGEQADENYEMKSRVIILLTDGQNNAGSRTPQEAAKLASDWGIKIYAIGIGGDDATSTVQSVFGTYRVPLGPGVDEETLRGVAEVTGGIYRPASDAEALREVYREIDELEKSEIETIRFVEYREAFVPFALSALILLALSILLGSTLFRRIP